LSAFLLRRFGQAVLLLFIVSMIGFAILHLAPGGPLSQFAAGGDMSQEDLDRIAEQLGLNRALPIQYAEWLWRMLAGDWGRSYRDGQPVLHIIGSHIGATLELMLTSTLLAMLIGAWIGILGAIRRYSLFDSLATIGAMIALSIPTFWFGLVVIYVFSVGLGWLPSGNRYTIGDGSLLNQIHHLIGPVMVLALVSTAVWSRYMRSSMLEVINQDYVRTARAKGLDETRVVTRHVLRNALLPMVTLIGLQAGTMLGGSVVVESVFSLPGLGRLAYESVVQRDLNTLLGIVFVSALLVIVVNFVVDLLYARLDPRIAAGG
jgi:peptide/nickel transport system permease protein